MAKPLKFKHAVIIWNASRGGLLCNRCFTTIREDFYVSEIEDKKYFCKKCEFELNFVIRGLNKRD